VVKGPEYLFAHNRPVIRSPHRIVPEEF